MLYSIYKSILQHVINLLLMADVCAAVFFKICPNVQRIVLIEAALCLLA